MKQSRITPKIRGGYPATCTCCCLKLVTGIFIRRVRLLSLKNCWGADTRGLPGAGPGSSLGAASKQLPPGAGLVSLDLR
jgi:hypothetical protein